MNAASNENLARIVKREDTLIDDESLRVCVVSHSTHLGLMIGMIETIAVQHDACKSGELSGCVDSAWRERLKGCAPLPEESTSLLERVATALRKARDVLIAHEGLDDGSSSPSDYSDSDSRSSSDMDEAEETEEDEESEDGEDEEPNVPSRRRHR